jgi:hypothetical protein
MMDQQFRKLDARFGFLEYHGPQTGKFKPGPLPREEHHMGIGTGIFLFAVGAILRYAVTVQTEGFNLHTIGIILMIVGVVTTVLSMFFWQSWGGFRRSGQDGTVVVREREVL